MQRTNAWRDRNIEKVRENERLWLKRDPKRAYLSGLKKRLAHPEKVRERFRNWAKRNADKLREKSNRRRAREAGASGWNYTTSNHIRMRWEMFGNKCWICGDKASQTDHVKPLDKGGSHYPANLRPICPPCNYRKKNRWPIPDYVFDRAKKITPGPSTDTAFSVPIRRPKAKAPC